MFRLSAVLMFAACQGDQPEKRAPGDADPGDGPADTGDTLPPIIDADGDGSPEGVDCDDLDPEIFPGAPERCGDGRITDCDRGSEEGTVTLDGQFGYDDLGAALAAASPGSDLLLCEGTFLGAFVATVPAKIHSISGSASTILSGIAGTSVLTLPGGSEIDGLTIGGGGPTVHGGGLLLTGAGEVVVTDSVIAGNRAEYGGGISVAAGVRATLVRSTVQGNTADTAGGGVEVREGGTLNLADEGAVTGNEATWFGGGVWLSGGSLVGGIVSDNTIARDVAESLEDYLYSIVYYGSGLPLPQSAIGGGGVAASGTAVLDGVTVTGNTGDGGGLSATFADVTLTNTSITSNEGEIGGGMLLYESTVALDSGTTIGENSAVIGGGAALFGASLSGGQIANNTASDEAGGLWLTQSSVEGTYVSGNDAFDGGGLFSEGHSALLYVLFEGNTAVEGGAVATQYVSYDPGLHLLEITGSALSGNSATRGAGIFAGSDLRITDTEISDNAASQEGGGLRLYVPVEEGPYAPPPDDVLLVEITGGSLLGNSASEGGAAAIAAGQLVASGVDLGTGADDNRPDDIQTSSGSYSYGADSSFVCGPSSCEGP